MTTVPPIEHVETSEPVLTAIFVLSNSLEEVGRDLYRADPHTRSLTVLNSYNEIPLDPGAKLLRLRLLDFSELEYENDAGVMEHLYPDRRSIYVDSNRGIEGSFPSVAFAAGLRFMPEIRDAVHQQARVLGQQIPLDAPTVYVVVLGMDTAATGNGLSMPMSLAIQRADKLLGDQARLHVIQITVQSSVHDASHRGRVERQVAYKAAHAAVAELATGLTIAGVEVASPLTAEFYILDAPGGMGEASEPEMRSFVYEMVQTMLYPGLRAKIDGVVKKWGVPEVVGKNAPLSGVAGHVVAAFDRDELARTAAVYQLPQVYNWLERNK